MERKYIKRSLESDIKKYINDEEIIAILGARQCGKTTLMKKIFSELKKAKFISFEDIKTLNLFTNNIDEFIKIYIEEFDYLFIDEFQYAKKGGKNLKYIYDNYNTKIIISGSSSSELSIQSIKYLVGRIFVFNLYPFSFEEFLEYKDKKLYEISKEDRISKEIINRINKFYNEFIIYGGYPRVIIEEDFSKKITILKNIYNTYILKEIKEILQIHEDEKINQIINSIALQIGSIINYNKLSSLTNIEFHKLKKYINILKKTFILIELKPYFTNKIKELSKSPKMYFLDNGFKNIVLEDFNDINKRTDSGQINENFIASELIKRDLNIKFWRTKAKAEVDFILEKQSKIFPIEVKTNIKNTNVTRSFKNFIEEYFTKKGYILSLNFLDSIKIKNTHIYFMPLFNVGKIRL